MALNSRSDRALHRQLADLIREDIRSGVLPPGALLPSEPRMIQEHGIGRETVRRAMALLRYEGLITTLQGDGTRVRRPVERSKIQLNNGDLASVRMPTPQERYKLDLDEGVPVFEVRHANGRCDLYPADRTHLVVD